MSAVEWSPWALVAVPILGALAGLPLCSTPREAKRFLLLTPATTGALVAVLSMLPGPGLPHLALLAIVPIAAFISLLSQPLHISHRAPWAISVAMLGLVLGVLIAPGRMLWVFVAVLLASLVAILSWARTVGTSSPTWGIATYGVGAVMAASAAVAPPVPAALAGLLAACTLLPLFPFHAGHVAMVMRLPGNLPAFLVTALPLVGLLALQATSADLPMVVAEWLGPAAIVSMIYGSVRALGQRHPLSVLAHASIAFASILWWFLAVTGILTPSSTVYVLALGLVTGGLAIGWYALRARHGELDIRALSGLVHPMPRFAVLFSLLALAALGMPPFGVFSGFMGMVLSPDFRLPASFFIVILVWLSASWYYLEVMRRLLFGPTRPEHRYEDMRETEVAALSMLLVLLVLLGTLPSRWFDGGGATRTPRPLVETTQWHP
ncbi:MAG: proton-conducting transporter membrane subunit [Nitrospiraceae bacterium]